MRWVGHVACMGEWKGAYRALVQKVMERGHLEDSDIGGWIIL